GCSFVVIAANSARAEFANFVADFVGIGAIADDITETCDMIPAPFRRVESGGKSSRVGVDIAKNEDPHANCPKRVTEYRGIHSAMHDGNRGGCKDDQMWAGRGTKRLRNF